MTDFLVTSGDSDSDPLGRILARLFEFLEQGEVVDIEAFLAQLGPDELVFESEVRDAAREWEAIHANATADTTYQPGFEIIPNHRIEGIIGVGAVGRVYLVRHVRDDRIRRAVKIIPASHPAAESELKIIRDLHLLARDDPRLAEYCVPPLDVPLEGRNMHGQSFHYYFMEPADNLFAENGAAGDYEPFTLGAWAGLAPPSAGSLLAVARDLCRGLTALHRKGFLHRDLKPTNIVRIRGRWRLADLGQVTRYVRSFGGGGTAGIVDPDADPAGPSRDLIPLGRTLYLALTRRDPSDKAAFERKIDEMMADVDDPQRAMLGRILEKACRGEYSHVVEMARDVKDALEQAPRIGTGLKIELARRRPDGGYVSLTESREPCRMLRGARLASSASEPLRVFIGDRIRVEVVARTEGYVTVFCVDASGEMVPLRPDTPGAAAIPIRLDGALDAEIDITPPLGRDRIFAVWTRKPRIIDMPLMREIVGFDDGRGSARSSLREKLESGGWAIAVREYRSEPR